MCNAERQINQLVSATRKKLLRTATWTTSYIRLLALTVTFVFFAKPHHVDGSLWLFLRIQAPGVAPAKHLGQVPRLFASQTTVHVLNIWK